MIAGIIFYDFQKADFKGCFEYVEKWMEDNEVPISGLGIAGRDKVLSYKGGKKILETEGYDRYEGAYGGGELKTNHGWGATTYLLKKEQIFYFCFFDVVYPFEEEGILKLSRDFSNFCDPKYGFSFLRTPKNMPNFYAFGYGTGLKDWPPNPERDEFERVQKWKKVYRPTWDTQIYKTGDLRDVYPYNFICHAHLDRIVHGITLEQFINQPGHGTLQPLTDTLWTWKLQSDEESNVREELRDTGILLCV